ncbi:hypothetical protein GCM10018980_40070 [Streptomyces capoamus]|uniref:DUF397 domain-containing protein n=1 Tax=Streptomyces capoamus TaxID=68183 RepID=A0A919EWA0_9ACTN|nr:DUF397 domain-containing protein [Streptomyces capoamus]GGW15170.1 hypothetical protein GCM10010501_26110 [Streptomyces libani subsp. rufus]GHG54980.1 hypothetical protein GCM10018980_40070 [Streptomyces capoamus]
MTTPAIVGPFVKSSASGQQDNCVEVAPLSDGGRAIRDSKDKTGPILLFTPAEWSAFVTGVRDAEFDL